MTRGSDGARSRLPLVIGVVFGLGLMIAAPSVATAQDPQGAGERVPASPAPPPAVQVRPVAPDEAIAERLTGILEATGWYIAPQVAVEDGVVFLEGTARTQEWSAWAEALAANTEDVVAVVNRLELLEGPLLDFAPAWAEVDTLWRETAQALPLMVVVVLIVLLTGALAFLTVRIGRRLLRSRIPSELLVNVTVWLLAAPVVLIGIYVALRVAGLTQLALTVLGGTGLAGLIIGIAFRDIAENFLASVLLSVRNPFHAGDRIELDGHAGIVQRITTRGTILMTLEGNHLQIPNSTVYKSTITNYTANPVRRMDFAVGIGYDASITEAQEAINAVLREHPVVLDDPEPLVLVEDLGSATVDLRAYFWFNGTQYEGPKLKSALIRLAKRALDLRGISMPDEAREVIFPQGVPIVGSLVSGGGEPPSEPTAVAPPGRPVEPDALSTDTEGGLRSEDASIKEQARHSRIPEAGQDLLGPADQT
jgi:small conductance mechanosensitive channel